MEKINERVVAIRSTLGLKQGEFAKRMGMKQTTLSMIEHDARLTETNLKLMCLTFGVNESWLRTGFGDMFTTDSYKEGELLALFRQMPVATQQIFLDYGEFLVIPRDKKTPVYIPIDENAKTIAAFAADIDDETLVPFARPYHIAGNSENTIKDGTLVFSGNTMDYRVRLTFTFSETILESPPYYLEVRFKTIADSKEHTVKLDDFIPRNPKTISSKIERGINYLKNIELEEIKILEKGE